LDDFGEQTTTPWAKEKLYQVINYRYNARLPTVITTRYSFDEIAKNLESSVSSRLLDGRLSNPFNITVPDYRGDAASQRKTSRRDRRGR
jgi:DNA replication protein DnaC